MSQQVGIVAAFAAGLLSFLSPCVLPLVPAYISFMTGMSLAELSDNERSATRVMVPVLMFVAGFTITFVAMGASASALGGFVVSNKAVLTKVAGAVIILFGIVLLDVVPLPWLHRGGFDASGVRKYGRWAALAFGLAFPFAIGACAGPVYGAILTLALDSRSIAAGSLLLLVYSLGLALPFVLVSLLLGRMVGTLKWLAAHSRTVNRVAGAILIVMGVLMVSGLIYRLSGALQSLPWSRLIG